MVAEWPICFVNKVLVEDSLCRDFLVLLWTILAVTDAVGLYRVVFLVWRDV